MLGCWLFLIDRFLKISEKLVGGANMEYILELSPENQLTIPSDIVKQLDLKAGSHFTAKTDGAQLLIEWLPFSSFVQAKSLDTTIKNLH